MENEFIYMVLDGSMPIGCLKDEDDLAEVLQNTYDDWEIIQEHSKTDFSNYCVKHSHGISYVNVYRKPLF